MSQTNKSSVVESRLVELNAELTDVNATLRQINDVIVSLRRQAETDPELALDAEFIDRMTVEGGRKGIMEGRKAEIEAEIDRLESRKRA